MVMMVERVFDLGLWNGVIAGAAPGVAAQDAPYGQVEALEGSVFLYGLLGILRAGGGETAGSGREGADAPLVEQDGQEQQPLQGCTDDVPEAFQDVAHDDMSADGSR